MADFNVRSDSVNVEQIMEQIRSRIRDKRGVDYTEDQIRELATVKLETFLDPRGVRSDLLEQFRRSQPSPPPLSVPRAAVPIRGHDALRFASRLRTVLPPVVPAAAHVVLQLERPRALAPRTDGDQPANRRPARGAGGERVAARRSVLRAAPQSGDRADADNDRGEERQDARRIDREPPRVQRAPSAGA